MNSKHSANLNDAEASGRTPTQIAEDWDALDKALAILSSLYKARREKYGIERKPARPKPSQKKPHQPEEISAEEIEHFAQAVLANVLPEGTILVRIAIALLMYIDKEGKLDLDDAFGFTKKQSTANPSKRLAQMRKRNAQLFHMAQLKADGAVNSISKAAGIVVSDSPEQKSAAALEREYSAKKWAKVENRMPQLDPDSYDHKTMRLKKKPKE